MQLPAGVEAGQEGHGALAVAYSRCVPGLVQAPTESSVYRKIHANVGLKSLKRTV